MMAEQKPYYLQRTEELGITAFENQLSVYIPGEEKPQMLQLLSGDGKDDNLLILYLDLQMKEGSFVALTHEIEVTGSFSDTPKKMLVPYRNTRLKKPVRSNKYRLPANAPAHPFLPPPLIQAYNSGLNIPLLILVEGSLKALKGSMHGAYSVGINGIWGLRGKGSSELHPIIKKIIEVCKVQHVLYLHDADFRKVNYSYLKDIGERPKNFADTVLAYQRSIQKYKSQTVKFFYGHPLEDGPKGLDDVFITYQGCETEILADLLQFQEAKRFFIIHQIPADFKTHADIKKYFYIDNPQNFYDHHSDLIGEDPYIFLGDFYQYNPEEDSVEMTLPKEVNDFVLVGNRYYKNIYELNSKGHPERVRSIRNTEIILDDFRRMNKDEKQAKALMLKIPKYDGYVNEPNFLNFKQETIIKERFKMLNLAYRLEHDPEPGEWPNIQQFLKHIFHNGGDCKYEVGLDMIQMYYTKPCQIQRILALVSTSNETGKTKFLELMRAIFGQNMSIIGSADFESQFNPYIVKSLVGVDESKIDDPRIIEMIKSMVTNPYANLNDKGVAAVQVVNRVKLIMTTNHVEDFASIHQAENKWFILDVGTVQNKDKELMEKMQAEIPAFLNFLLHRELKYYSHESRFAIPDHIVETKALQRIKENSKPEVLLRILDYLKDRFADFGEEEIKIDAKRLHELIFGEKNFRYTPHDIGRTIKQHLNMEPISGSKHFRFPKQEVRGEETLDENTGELILPEIITTWEYKNGRYYVFPRAQFE